MAGAVTLNLRAVDNVSPALRKADASAKTFNKTVQASKGNLNQAQNSIIGFGKGARAAGFASKGAIPGIVGMGAAVQAALGPIALITGGIGALTAVVGELASLDEATTKFETLGGSGEELQASLKKVVAELDNSVSVGELVGGAYDVASAGFTDAADAAKILKVAALGAKGGFSDLDTTASATVKVLNAYGLEADSAGKLMDQFVQTQNDGIVTVDAYAQHIGKVASVASMLKIPLAEVNAVIAQSTAAGVNAEVAFTGMKTALLKLSGSRGAKKLEKLGIDISAATIESEGLLKTLKKLEGLDTKAIGDIFGAEAIQVMAPVLNDLEKYEKLINNQIKASGTAKEANDKMTNTMKGAWTELSNIFKNAFADQTALGDLITATIQITSTGLKLIGALLAPAAKGLKHISSLLTQIAETTNWLIENTTGFFSKILGKAETDTALKEAAENTNEIKTNVEAAAPKVEEVNTELTKTKGITKEINEEATLMQDTWLSIGESIKTGVTGAVKGAIQGTKSLGQAASEILSDISNKILDMAINMALWGAGGKGGLFGGMFSNIFGSAQGGTIGAGNPRIVGERGPELFVPHSSGKVIPNNRLGGGTVINVSVDASETNVSANGGEARQLGSAIAVAIQQQLIKERRPGGLLAT